MGGQNIERRDVLRVLAAAAGAAQFPGFQRWSFACPQHHEGALVNPATGPYHPRFFTPPEYRTLEILCDLIIPADGSPGAKEAGASEFIDFLVFSDAEIQFGFRYGLGWLDGHSRYLWQKTFAELSREQQSGILEHLAYKDKHRPGEEDGRAFFALVREYTVMGYYTSRVGMQELDDPGLKIFYEHMPEGCPHTDDREHKHLQPVRN